MLSDMVKLCISIIAFRDECGNNYCLRRGQLKMPSIFQCRKILQKSAQ